jgi:Ni/Fe-hydrogenase subunit HybB-like protein
MAREPTLGFPYPVFVTGAVLVLVAMHLQPAGGVVSIRSSPLYAMNVLFFAGASAGAIVVARFSQAARLPGAAAFVTLADLGALTGLALALIFAGLDLARQDYLWHREWSIHFSPVDVMIVALYLSNALAVAYLALHLDLPAALARVPRGHRLRAVLALGHWTRLERSRAGHLVFWEMLTLLLPAALLLQSTPAWIMSRLGDESAWQATEISVFCYGSNLIAGLALAVGAALLGRVSPRVRLDTAAMHRLGPTFLVAIPVLGYCLFGEARAVLAVKEPAASHLLQELVRGGSAAFFWSALAAGVVVPFALVGFSRGPTVVRLGIAAGLMSGAVLIERGIVAVALLLGHAHRLYSPDGYGPGVHEVVVTVGVYLVGLLTFRSLIGLRFRRGA